MKKGDLIKDKQYDIFAVIVDDPARDYYGAIYFNIAVLDCKIGRFYFWKYIRADRWMVLNENL